MSESKFEVGDRVRVKTEKDLDNKLVYNVNNGLGYYVGKTFIKCDQTIFKYAGELVEIIDTKCDVAANKQKVRFIKFKGCILWFPSICFDDIYYNSVPARVLLNFCNNYCLFDYKEDCPLYDYRINNISDLSSHSISG